MKRQFSMPEYYQFQGMLAKKYNIADHHAGCHIIHYGVSDLCAMCTHAEECARIFEQEKDSGIYKE